MNNPRAIMAVIAFGASVLFAAWFVALLAFHAPIPAIIATVGLSLAFCAIAPTFIPVGRRIE